MPSLPAIHGKYPVGATDFTVPLHSTTYIGKAKLKHGETVRPALALEEVAFTAFYPARTSKDKAPPLDWLVRCVCPIIILMLGVVLMTEEGQYAQCLTGTPISADCLVSDPVLLLLDANEWPGITKWVFWPIMYLYGSRITVRHYPYPPSLPLPYSLPCECTDTSRAQRLSPPPCSEPMATANIFPRAWWDAHIVLTGLRPPCSFGARRACYGAPRRHGPRVYLGRRGRGEDTFLHQGWRNNLG